MSIVQPGFLPSYNPSVSLENYSDTNRVRFLFNGSQFVKAVFPSVKPTYAYVGYYNTSNVETLAYTNYINEYGEYALVDGEKYLPSSTGAPASGYGQYVVVAYPSSVYIHEVVMWSISSLSFYDSFVVSYSYDGSTYYDTTISAITEVFDDTLPLYAGESPPTGQYKYTITLSSSYNAKYLKISAHTSTLTTTATADGGTSIVVASTTGFPSVWSSLDDTPIRMYGLTATTPRTFGFTYGSVTGTSFVDVVTDDATWGAGGESLIVSSTVFCRFSFVEYLTEIELSNSNVSFLELWDTDGDEASSQLLTYDDYYDITCDTGEDCYYTIRLNSDLNGTFGAGFTLSDYFDGYVIDTARWVESEDYSNFTLNSVAHTLEYVNTANLGELITNYYFDGDFTSEIGVSFTGLTVDDTFFKLELVEKVYNNTFICMGFNGKFTNLVQDYWEASQLRITTDTTGGAAKFRNIKLDTASLTAGSKTYTFVYDSTGEYWAVTDGLGATYNDVTPGADWSDGPFLSLSISHIPGLTVPDSAQFVLTLNVQRTSLPAYGTQTAWRVGIDRTGTSVVCKYDPGTGSFTDWVTYTDTYTSAAKLALFVDGKDGSFDLSLDDFVVTGTESVDNDIPVFSIEAVDSNGWIKVIPALTDASGYLIKRFDIINEHVTFNNYSEGKVQITTDGTNVFIKINGDLYKYAKSSLPLDLEDGSTASVYKASVIPETTAKAFSYNAYSKAGLCYVEYDDDLEGLYLRTLGTSTLSGTLYEAPLDLASSSYPFAWDINNYTTMYYVDSTALKMFDMDENDVAFCNVVSEEKIMSAGSSDTSSVVATVLNPYGEPLSSKTVTFSVSAGAGSVSPESVVTSGTGQATAVYTVGDSVGTTTITAVASD